jgi:hypothetical protein
MPMFLSSMVTGTANYVTSYAKQATKTATKVTKGTVKGAADYFHGKQDPIHNLKKEIKTTISESQFGRQLQQLSSSEKFQLMILLIHCDLKSIDPLKKSCALKKIETFFEKNILKNRIHAQESLDDIGALSIKDTESPYSASDYAQALTAFEYETVARMQGTLICGTAEALIRFLFLPDDPNFLFSFYDILTSLSTDAANESNLDSYSDLPIFYDFLKQYFYLKSDQELLTELQSHRISWIPYFPSESTS